MSKYDVLLLLSLWASIITAVPLDAGQNAASIASINSAPADLSQLNASTLGLNVSVGGSFEVKCNGTTYGVNPSLSDCESAREYITPDSTQQTFGQRHTGLPDDTFPLPFRMMGGR